jgi:two-component SAPR family response regulator
LIILIGIKFSPFSVLDILEEYIGCLEQLELVHPCSNAIEAYNILKREKVDLLFADIQMPQLSGMELVRNLPSKPKIIFTTAYR